MAARILIAPDKYKGTLSARGVAEALATGIHKALPDADVSICPAADGGEGTAETLVDALGGQMVSARVAGLLGEPVTARYGIAGRTAVIEMAAASGLALLAPDELRPLDTSTHGTGELMAAALDAGCTKLIVGIGGSATTDGGAGMAAALGARLLDEGDRPLDAGGGALCRLARIDVSQMAPALARAEVLVACDVTNPLLGEHGAARVYGPQKGAAPAQVEELERCLARYADVVERDLGVDVRGLPGGGAAGGLGAGLVAFCNATLRPGVEIVLDALDFDGRVRGADLVVTGEGMIDGQSARGKTPVGVARAAKRAGVRVIAVAGQRGMDAEQVLAEGIDEIIALAPDMCSIEEATANPGRWLELAGEHIGRELGPPAR